MGSDDRGINNSMSNLKLKGNGILLCCGKDKCPMVTLKDDNKVSITDDDGNTITVDIDQASLLPQAIDKLKNSK
tara:strand:- start:190 stop:411 length:222 start_codon:yes stop_codon:yes gene_type:complete